MTARAVPHEPGSAGRTLNQAPAPLADAGLIGPWKATSSRAPGRTQDRTPGRAPEPVPMQGMGLVLVLVLVLALALAAPLQASAQASPAWERLTPAQRQTLAPLQPQWAAMEAGQRQKWLALARRLDALPPAERQRIQARMAGWAALPPQDRHQARQQFRGARQLSAEERLAQWERYVALSEEERQAVVGRAAPPAGSAGVAGQSGPTRLAPTPRPVVKGERKPPLAAPSRPSQAATVER